MFKIVFNDCNSTEVVNKIKAAINPQWPEMIERHLGNFEIELYESAAVEQSWLALGNCEQNIGKMVYLVPHCGEVTVYLDDLTIIEDMIEQLRPKVTMRL